LLAAEVVRAEAWPDGRGDGVERRSRPLRERQAAPEPILVGIVPDHERQAAFPVVVGRAELVQGVGAEGGFLGDLDPRAGGER
jgi:hypothetical protein